MLTQSICYRSPPLPILLGGGSPKFGETRAGRARAHLQTLTCTSPLHFRAVRHMSKRLINFMKPSNAPGSFAIVASIAQHERRFVDKCKIEIYAGTIHQFQTLDGASFSCFFQLIWIMIWQIHEYINFEPRVVPYILRHSSAERTAKSRNGLHCSINLEMVLQSLRRITRKYLWAAWLISFSPTSFRFLSISDIAHCFLDSFASVLHDIRAYSRRVL